MLRFMRYHMLLLFLYYIRIARTRTCTDKTEKSAPPQGLKEIPVVLNLVTLGDDATLPCHYCDEKQGTTGRIWRRKNLHGKMMEVKLDMHDDELKNRVFVDREHTLVIRNVEKMDAAYYFCYDIENSTGTAKMEILLDVIKKNPLEPKILRSPVDINVAVPPLLKGCDKLKSVKSLSNYNCYAEWSPWSRCDVCGKVGKRRRVGTCRLQRVVKTKVKSSEGKEIEADFPIVGVGCNSFLLDVIPEGKTILSAIPNIVLLEKCEVSCEDFIPAANEMTAHKRNAFLKKVKLKSLRKMTGVKHAISIEVKEEVEGRSVALFCPGSTLDTPIRWMYMNKVINPKRINEKTNGRVIIDVTDVLHIKSARPMDSGEYICTLYDVEIGLIRLKVSSRFIPFDWNTNFGLLTIVLTGCFIIYMGFMSTKCRSYQKQRKVQRLQLLREELGENDEMQELLEGKHYSLN